MFISLWEFISPYLGLSAEAVIFIILIVMTWMGASKRKGWSRFWIIAIGIFAILLNIFVLVNSNEAKKESDRKLDFANNQLADTKKQLEDTEKKIDELLRIVKRNFPQFEGLDVDSIIEEMKRLEQRTRNLEEKTKETDFELVESSRSVKQLSDGTYETNYKLLPIGNNIVPLLKLICQTTNNAQISSMRFTDASTFSHKISDNGTHAYIEREAVPPKNLYIKVYTDIEPQMNCIVDLEID